MSGNVVAGQSDFGAGIYRGREAPPNAAYDLVNFLLDDEGQPFRRGGSAYKSNANAGSIQTLLSDVVVYGGQRTLFGSASGMNVLSADDATPLAVVNAVNPLPLAQQRPAAVNGYVAWLTSGGYAVYYAGSRKPNYTAGGTLTLTNGSKTVTGLGTLFTANVDHGMLVGDGMVDTVTSDTSLSLRDPFPGFTTSGSPASAWLRATIEALLPVSPPTTDPQSLTAAAQRLIWCQGNRAYYTLPGSTVLTNMNYHELPASTLIIGAQGTGNELVVFTSSGVWTIANLDFDALDDVGNVQHIVRQVNEIILWGDGGIAQWRGALVAPCIDDVWLMPVDAPPEPIGGGMKPLYISYVKAGYQPGTASVHRGHYVLPVLNGTTVVDVLVCRLDRNFAWTRWSGHGAGAAYAQRIGATTRSPKLFSISGQRVTELTDAWSPSASNASEADGTTHPITIETRDLPTGSAAAPGTTAKLRVVYEATAAGTPTFTASYARGPAGAAYTALPLLRGGGVSDGLDRGSVWTVAKKAPAIRFRIQSSSALSTFKLRSLEAPWRQAT